MSQLTAPAYPPNTHQWERGNLVIHRSDAKKQRMLMRVTGFTKNGLVKTEYVFAGVSRGTFENDLAYLLDPADFSIPLPEGARA